MPKFPVLSGQQIIKVLNKIGYLVLWQKGSHIRLNCLILGRKRVTIPNYKSIDKSLLSKILRNAEITLEDFLKLM